MARLGHNRAPGIGQQAFQRIIDPRVVMQGLAALHQQARRRNTPKPARGQQPGLILVDLRVAGRHQMNARHHCSALALGDRPPRPAITAKIGENARCSLVIARLHRRIERRQIFGVLALQFGAVLQGCGKKHRLDQHQAAHQIGAGIGHAQRHCAAKAVADQIDRAIGANQVDGLQHRLGL